MLTNSWNSAAVYLINKESFIVKRSLYKTKFKNNLYLYDFLSINYINISQQYTEEREGIIQSILQLYTNTNSQTLKKEQLKSTHTHKIKPK